MKSKSNYILQKGQSINDKYYITFSLRKGNYAETYRVKDKNKKPLFLKLFSYSKLDKTQFDVNDDIQEIEILKKISHPNIVKYKDSGEIIIENKKYAFVILDFVSGESLANKLQREQVFNSIEAKEVVVGVLNGLNYLHGKSPVLIHNEISLSNIMLDLSKKVSTVKITDFGYARFVTQPNRDFNKNGLNPFYTANECFNKVFSIQSDIFSVGALYYHMLFGLPPWFIEISKYKSNDERIEELISEERKKPLKVINTDVKVDDSTLAIIKKALQPEADSRFESVQEFIQAINGDIEILVESSNPKNLKPALSKKQGSGFKGIAGMSSLKEKLKNDVIDVIENPEEYDKHGLSIPNGMLLYGPPGCGKTFFAEKFAEEAGYNFIKVISSDIASIYIHGSQEKIGQIFKEAKEQAPTILYFDELDAMVPKRENANNQSQSGEVNEFLSQLDNIGEAGVFVIGSTNKPDSIDKAILRAGRMEKWYFIPPPDFEARRAMFELYLKDRPIEFGINYEDLAKVTDNYVASDIKLIVDEASRKAVGEFKSKKADSSRISMETLKFIIDNQKPTVQLSEIKKYDAIRNEIEGIDSKNSQKGKIGFRQKD